MKKVLFIAGAALFISFGAIAQEAKTCSKGEKSACCAKDAKHAQAEEKPGCCAKDKKVAANDGKADMKPVKAELRKKEMVNKADSKM